MAKTGPLHWVGVVCLLLSSILLLVTTISAPVVKDIAMLQVILTNQTTIRNSSVTFGTFGYCVLDVPPIETDQDWCSSRMIGYQPASEMATIDGGGFGLASAATADGLTHVMVLHPVASGLAFIAFLLSVGAGVVGSLLGTMVAFLAFLITLVVLAVDFTLFGIVRNHVNSDGSGSVASFSTGIWTVLAAFILLFIGMVIVFLTCFSARRAKKNHTTGYKNEQPMTNTTTTTHRRKFWQRGNRY